MTPLGQHVLQLVRGRFGKDGIVNVAVELDEFDGAMMNSQCVEERLARCGIVECRPFAVDRRNAA